MKKRKKASKRDIIRKIIKLTKDEVEIETDLEQFSAGELKTVLCNLQKEARINRRLAKKYFDKFPPDVMGFRFNIIREPPIKENETPVGRLSQEEAFLLQISIRAGKNIGTPLVNQQRKCFNIYANCREAASSLMWASISLRLPNYLKEDLYVREGGIIVAKMEWDRKGLLEGLRKEGFCHQVSW